MPNILIVEDEIDSATPMILTLSRAGYGVTHVINGQQALNALGKGAPDLIVLDIRLPILDGISFMQILRSYLRWSDIPVIVVTAVHDADLDRIAQLGVQRVLRKAEFHLDELLHAVSELLPPPAQSA